MDLPRDRRRGVAVATVVAGDADGFAEIRGHHGRIQPDGERLLANPTFAELNDGFVVVAAVRRRQCLGMSDRRNRLVAPGPAPGKAQRIGECSVEVQSTAETANDGREDARAQIPGRMAVRLRRTADGEIKRSCRGQSGISPTGATRMTPPHPLEWLIGSSGVPVAPAAQAPRHVVPGAWDFARRVA